MTDKLILRGIAAIIRLLLRQRPDDGMDASKLANEMEKAAK